MTARNHKKSADAARVPGGIQRRESSTRRAILQAAMAEFAAKGFEGASLQSVARSLDLQLTLVQRHFGDKGSLWSAVLTEIMGGLRAQVDRIFSSDRRRRPASILSEALEALIRYAAANDTFVDIVLQARPAHSEFARACQQDLHATARRWIQMIESAQAQGDFVAGNPLILFYQMIGAALRIFAAAADSRTVGGRPATDASMLEDHVQTCLRIFMPNIASKPQRRTAAKRSGAATTRVTDVPRPATGPSTFYLLCTLASVFRKRLDEELKQLDITQSQLMALIRIADEHKLSSARLARMLNVSAQSVVVFVRALEQRGLIERSQSKHSKRVLTINVTPAGHKVLAKLRTVVAVADQHLLEGLSTEQRALLQDLLARILNRHRPLALRDWSPLLSPN